MMPASSRIALALSVSLSLSLALPALGTPAAAAEARVAPTAGPEAEATRAVTDPGPDADIEAARPFHLKRAGLDLAVLMGLGVAWYQWQIEANKLDFDFDRTWSDQWRRISTAAGYRFDDNNPRLNVGHAFVGAYYHQFARANGGGMLEALLFDFVTSSTWELGVEHREVFSVNDTVVTTFGGVAIGEGLYQIGDYFGRSRPTIVNRVLMGLFSPARALAALHGDRLQPSGAGFDQHGLANDAHHDFALSLGGARLVAGDEQPGEAWEGDLRLDLELVNLRSYGRAAARDRALKGGEFTRMIFEYNGDRQDMRQLQLTARSSLFGLYHQRTVATGVPGGLVGHSRFLGSMTAFDLFMDDRGAFSDWTAAIHVVGPAADVTVYRDRWAFRASGEVTPDFALVRSFALDTGAPPPRFSETKSTLHDDSYYYALGVTAAARLEVRYADARAGADVGYSHFDSIEGLDRHQEAYRSPTGIDHPAITDDVDLTDDRLKVRLYSEAPVPFTPVKVGVNLDWQQRRGIMGERERARERAREDLRVGLHATYAM